MGSPLEPDFAGLLARLTHALSAHDLPFMLIGGQAVLLHGEPRLTHDIDVTLAAAPSRLNSVLAACADAGIEPLPSDIDAFVRDTFVLPCVDEQSDIRVDLIFSTTDYESQAIERAVRVDVAGTDVPFATAEDLVLHKLFAGRARDLEDARGIVRRKGEELDWSYLRTWAGRFAETPGREQMPRQVEELASERD